jgi:poly(3-hydroxybutyrate) depolymerase
MGATKAMLKRIRLAGASIVFVASLVVVLPDGLAGNATADTISGASQAVCTPAPCVSPKGLTSYTLTNVPNGDGTTSTREYSVYRPANLTPLPANLAPAVLVFYQSGNCGLKPSGRFASLAPRERFIVVYMEVPCERREHNWDKRNVDPTTSSAVNDEPYVTAVVGAIKQCPSSGAGPNQCVDPQRIYAAGASSGGNMTADVMCDVENSPLFRGYLIDSSSLQLFNGAPNCPSPNRSFFVMMALSNYSIDGGLYYDTAPNPHLDVPLFADWAAKRLGCEGQRVDDAIGSPVASTLRYTYSGPCAYAVAGSPAIVTLGVQNGGHTWSCQDSDAGEPTPSYCLGIPNPPGLTPNGLPYTNGLFMEEDFWNFVAQGVSTEATATPLEETSPPVVSVTSPSNGSTVSGTVSINVRATDDVEVAGVRLELDGTDLGPLAAAGTAGTYSLSWNTATAANGSHVLRAVADDIAGNLAIASTLVTVENTGGGGGSLGTGGGGGSLLTGGGGGSLLTGGGGGSLLTGGGGGSLLTVNNNAPSNLPPSFVALGDAYSSGEGNSLYLPGTDTARDRCHRSTISYPFIASAVLSGGPSGLVFRACSGAKIADFYGANRRNHEPRQLQWIGSTTRLVSLSVGWDDALLPEVLQSCVLDSLRCEAGWRVRAEAATRAIGAHSLRNRKSLYVLYKKIVSLAPKAQVVVFGYPRLFPAVPPARCGTGVHALSFTRASMEWINSEIRRLDGAIKSAATVAHVRYVGASYKAFGGHERCTRQPEVNGALTAARVSARGVLDGSFSPNSRGEVALATLLERAF